MPPAVISLTITGEFSIDEVAEVFTKRFVDRIIKVDKSNESQAQASTSVSGKEINIQYSATAEQLQHLKLLLERKTKEMKDMEASSTQALTTLQSFQREQKALFDEFMTLHQKYDEQKQALTAILWDNCTIYDPALKNIPPIDKNRDYVETDSSVNDYTLGEELGSGQFAAVRVCWHNKNKNEALAIKVIKKDRICTHLGLSRLSEEVGLLKKMRNDYVISIRDTLQTDKHFYIVTEKGGADMFEFFENYDDGVPEVWAKDIMACVLISVNACHEVGVCHRGMYGIVINYLIALPNIKILHRHSNLMVDFNSFITYFHKISILDLKPENILLQFDVKKQCVTNFKLCDFGLGSEFSPKVPLTDFCGSPGMLHLHQMSFTAINVCVHLFCS